jgi:hypothetical protein
VVIEPVGSPRKRNVRAKPPRKDKEVVAEIDLGKQI